MATIHRTLPIDRPADEVWSALSDVGAVHERLARGFVVDTLLDGPCRTVTFANGAVARELVVSIDHDRRRLAYSVVESSLGLEHHHAVFTVTAADADGAGCRLDWMVDLTPDRAAPAVAAMVETGAAAIQATFRRSTAG
jgi:hypothetical protein